jgi:CrcB protein
VPGVTRAPLLAPVFAGGAIGGLLRVAVSEAAGVPAGSWPWATLIVNLAGALVLGAAYEALRDARSAHARLFLGTGFCGGLTTFSTFQVELLDLADAGEPLLALLYAAVSIGGGLAVSLAGARGARAVIGDARIAEDLATAEARP